VKATAQESKVSSQSSPQLAQRRRQVQPEGATEAAQLAVQINSSPRVQLLAQLREQIHQSPRLSAQLYGNGGLGAGALSLQAKPKEEKLQAKPKEKKLQAKPKEEKLQAKPKEEKLQAKPKEELRQRRAADASSSSGASPAATSAGSASGLPPQLKSGVESLSGMSMDHVHVNYNSAKPAQLNALAYAQGSEIHVGPGQEQHLPHEAWHVVQQAQGRVPATKQLKDGVAINDSKALEHEADVMGAKATQLPGATNTDNQTKMAAQLEQRPGIFQNTAQLRISDDKSSGSVFQRKIHVKSGKKYDSASSETDKKTAKIATADGIYLVQSDNDIDKMKRGEDVPVLAPKRHLIGEVHSASRYSDAVAAWGWGAEPLIESYSKHAKLKNPKQTEKKKTSAKEGVYDQNFIDAMAKGLEDTAVKGLANLVNAQIFGSKALKIANKCQNVNTFTNLDKVQLKTSCSTIWIKYDLAADVVQSLQDYLQESKAARGFGWFGDYFPEHQQIEQVVTQNLAQCIIAGRKNVSDQYFDENNSHLDPVILTNCNNAIDSLVPLLQKLIVAYDPGVFSLPDIKQASDEAKQSNDIEKLSPLREAFMVRNIAAAKIPALVKIGIAHVQNLQNNLPAESIPYDDYAAFETKNTWKNVDV